MTFDLIRTFLLLAETKNFTKTSEMLYISQPTVTARIKALESEVGHTLIYRTNKLVELTPAGMQYLAHANRIFQAMIDSQEFMRSYQTVERQIVVSAPGTNWDFLPRFRNSIITYAKMHPEIFLHLNRAISQYTLEKLADGSVTLGIVYNMPSMLEYDVLPYHQEKMYLVSAKDAQFTVDGNKIIGENGPPPFIQLDFGITINHLAEDIFYTLPRIMTTEHPLLQLHLISSGLGIGLLQESVAKVGIKEGKLSLINCEYNNNPLLFQNYLAYSKKNKHLVEDLVSYLMENSPSKGTGETESFPFPDTPVQWPVL